MEAILYSVDEEDPKFKDTWVSTFDTSIFGINSFTFKADNIFFILWNKTWNFTSSEHTVHVLKESLTLDFSISENESDRFTSWTGFSVKVLDIFLHVVVIVSLGQLDLEEDLLTDEGGKFSQ